MKRAAVLIVFALALVIRLWHITQAPLDFHPARQYRGAEIARGFFMPGNDRYPAWEQHVAAVDQFQDGVLEPPVLEFGVAQIYKLAHAEILWAPRVLSILFWLIAGGIVYLLAVRLTGKSGAAWVSMLYFLFDPYGIVASRSFQPEPFMVLLLLVALLLILRYFENPSGGKLVVAAAIAAAALFIKPTCLFILFAVFGLLLLQRRGLTGALRDPGFYIFAAVTLVPSVAYYTWGFLFVPKLQAQAGTSFIAALFTHASYWEGWLRNIGRTVGIIPFVIAVCSIQFFPRGLSRAFILGGFLGYFLYGLAFNYHIHTHDYYSLQLIPIVALALGPAGIAVVRWVAEKRRQPAWWAAAAGVAVLLAAAGFGFLKFGLKSASPSVKDSIKESNLLVGLSEKIFMFVHPSYYRFDQQLADDQTVGEATHHSLRTIYLDPDEISVVYIAEIAGKPWVNTAEIANERLRGLPPISVEERFNRDFKPMNPEYFIITDYGEYLREPDLVQFLQTHFLLVASKERRYLVFRINPPSANPPST